MKEADSGPDEAAADAPELLAQPATIERLMSTIITKVLNQGYRVTVEGDMQIDMEVIDGSGVTGPLSLYYFAGSSEHLVCQAETAQELNKGTTYRTRYDFYKSDGQESVEKFSRVEDSSKQRDIIKSFMAGDDQVRLSIEQMIYDEKSAEYETEDYARQVGIATVTESEIQELERLILTGRII